MFSLPCFQASKEQDATKKHRSAKRKRDVNHQEWLVHNQPLTTSEWCCCFAEHDSILMYLKCLAYIILILFYSSTCSCAEKKEKFASPSTQDASQSTREIKKPVYRLTKTQATNQKPLTEEKDCKKIRSGSSREKKYVSEKYSGSRSKTRERESSRRSSENIPQRREEVSKGSLDEKFSQRTSSKLKGELMSPSLVPAESKQHMQYVLKRKYSAKEPPGSGKDRSSIKTREPSKISFSKDSQQQKGEHVENQCPSQHKSNSKTAKRQCTEAKAPTPSPVSSKDCTTISSSNAISYNVKSTSLNAKSSSVQQPACSGASKLTPNFKIPKMVQSRPVDHTERNRNRISSKGNFKHGIELSDSGASQSNLQTTVQPSHSCLDVAPSLSSDRSGRDSFFTGKLPATSKTEAEPWCDEVKKKSFIQSFIHCFHFIASIYTFFFIMTNKC